jgi:alkylation response protein AidB-like acyl-CoA dehydrogenase
LLDELSARATESEQAGTMPLDLVDRLRDAGVFRMLQPTPLGGLEVTPREAVDAIECLSHADGSAGWIASIGAGGGVFAAWLEPAVAIDVFGTDADLAIATVFAPTRSASSQADASTSRDFGRSRAGVATRGGSSWGASCSTATFRG